MGVLRVLLIALIISSIFFSYKTLQKYRFEDNNSITMFPIKAIINISSTSFVDITRMYLLDTDNDGVLEIVIYMPSLLSDMILEIYDKRGKKFIKESVSIPLDMSKNNSSYVRTPIEWFLAATLVDVDCDGNNELILTTPLVSAGIGKDISYLYVVRYSGAGYYLDRYINISRAFIDFIGFIPEFTSIHGEVLPINLDSDKYPEYILPIAYGFLYLDDYYNNFSIMRFLNLSRTPTYPMQLDDVDGDGDIDLICRVGNKGTYIIDVRSGDILQTFRVGPFNDSLYLYSVDIDGDYSKELLGFVIGDGLALANISGGLTWLVRTSEDGLYNDIFAYPAFADLDFDGRYEVVACAITDSRRYLSLLVIDDDLRTIDRFVFVNTTYGLAQRPAIGDINGDGALDIVVGTENVVHFIDGRSLEQIWLYNFSDLGDFLVLYNLIGDVDGDGFAEVVSMSDGHVVVFGSHGFGSPWPTYHVDNSHSCRINDSDRDSFADYLEPFYGLDPNNADSDGDGLADGFEFFVVGTDPLSADTDGDLFSDYLELLIGSDPRDPFSPWFLFGFLLVVIIAVVLWKNKKKTKDKSYA